MEKTAGRDLHEDHYRCRHHRDGGPALHPSQHQITGGHCCRPGPGPKGGALAFGLTPVVAGIFSSGMVAYAEKAEEGYLLDTATTMPLILCIAAAVLMIILGIFNGGMNDVLQKAIRICTECIGLG